MAEVIAFRKREKPKVTPVETAPVRRLEALDILRGLCVIGMILVAYAGDWQNRFGVLNHAEWQGLALADMIFPGFLFCVGMAIPLSFSGRALRQTKGELALHVLWRALALILLGTVLNYIDHPDIYQFRLPGILQRIGLCYGLAGGFCLLVGRKSDHDFTVSGWPVVVVTLVVGLGYAAALKLWTGPECAGACFDSVNSLPAVVDRAFFSPAYMWHWGLTDGVVTYDPEGLVSTFGAAINVLLGIVVSLYIRRNGIAGSLIGLVMLGIFLALTGLGMNGEIPVIKKIWTPSFALISAGFSVVMFVGLALLADVFKAGAWAYPAKIFGANATLAFVLISLFNVGLNAPVAMRTDGTAATLRDGIANSLGSLIAEPRVASLAYSVLLVVVIGLILWPLYRKRWFLKL